MTRTKPFLFVALSVCLLLHAGCMRHSAAVGGGTSPEVSGADLEYGIKQKGMLKAADLKSRPLKFGRRIQSELGGNDKFVYPVSLAISDRGVVYISDNNANLIRYYSPDSDSILNMPIQPGQGKLVYPNWVKAWKDSFLVTDNDGIKVFKTDGTFQRLLRSFYQINDFAVGPDGKIFINPSFVKRRADNPLIVELDSTGKRVNAFGTRLNGPDSVGLSDELHLCIGGEYVFAAFRHSPLIKIFSTSGTFVREFSVDHPAFPDLTPLSGDAKFINPEPSKFRLPTYISGARVVGDRLFVLLDLPQPEIVEFTFEGREENRYRADISPPARTYKGFDVQRAGNTYQFWILYGDNKTSIELVEMTPSEGM